jgi:hypothetical protein
MSSRMTALVFVALVMLLALLGCGPKRMLEEIRNTHDSTLTEQGYLKVAPGQYVQRFETADAVCYIVRSRAISCIPSRRMMYSVWAPPDGTCVWVKGLANFDWPGLQFQRDTVQYCVKVGAEKEESDD